MVFAAGLGKRMLPLTEDMPKPLIKVAGKALIDYSLDSLAQAGIERAVVNTHYFPDMLKDHVLDREGRPEVFISYEKELLDTGGGVFKALPLLGARPFISVNSDSIILDGKKSAFKRMFEEWEKLDGDVLMLLQPVEKAVGYDGEGDFGLTEDGRLTRSKSGSAPYVFTGAMIMRPEIFADAPDGVFSIYRDFIHDKYILPDGSLSRVYGIVHDGKWLHVGTPDGVKLAEKEMAGVVARC